MPDPAVELPITALTCTFSLDHYLLLLRVACYTNTNKRFIIVDDSVYFIISLCSSTHTHTVLSSCTTLIEGSRICLQTLRLTSVHPVSCRMMVSRVCRSDQSWLKGLQMIQFEVTRHSNPPESPILEVGRISLFPLLALWGNKNWPPV